MAVPRITKEELKTLLDGEAKPLVLDVRLKYPYEHSTVRLPDAVRMPESEISAGRLPRDREIVAYDSDPDELVSARITAALIRQGYRARALKGGIVDWITAKLPTENKEAPMAAPPTPGSLKG